MKKTLLFFIAAAFIITAGCSREEQAPLEGNIQTGENKHYEGDDMDLKNVKNNLKEEK